jgi:succinoglycan biosynthesis protein ExoA
MRDLPFVTVAVPCLDEREHIDRCLSNLRGQDYPWDRMEIVIADGGSTDGTMEILRRVAAADPRVRVVDNPDRVQAAGLNAVLRVSHGDVIVRADVHSEYARDYVRKCVEVLARTGAENVGGAQRTRAGTRFQEALCAALESPLGAGGARYRSAEEEGYSDTVFLGAYRRSVFETVGMFDPGAVTNEDAELNQRILEGGGRIYLTREIVVHYHPRSSFSELARQYYRYGRGRARTALKHRGLPVVRPLLPFLLVAFGATVAATPFAPIAFALYAASTGVEALRVGRSAGLSAAPLVWGMFPVMHVAHGVGFAAGLVRHVLHADSGEPPRLAPRGDMPARRAEIGTRDGAPA